MPDPSSYDGRRPEPPYEATIEATDLREAIQTFLDAAWVNENTGEWEASSEAFDSLFRAIGR